MRTDKVNIARLRAGTGAYETDEVLATVAERVHAELFNPQASTGRPTDAAGLHAPEETSDSGAHSIVSALKCDCGADADTMSGACWRCVRTRTGLPPVDTRHAREVKADWDAMPREVWDKLETDGEFMHRVGRGWLPVVACVVGVVALVAMVWRFA